MKPTSSCSSSSGCCTSYQSDCVVNNFPPFLDPFNTCKRPYMPLSLVTYKGSVWQCTRPEYSTPGDAQTSWRRINMAGLVELLMATFECQKLKAEFKSFNRCDDPPAGLGDVRAYDGKLWISNEAENYSTPSASNPKWSMGYTVDQLVKAVWDSRNTSHSGNTGGSTDFSALPQCS